ncbi:hypothetical protein [Paracidovorax cattleyae]|uniref:hypothetical protein n=1 Tax=Paracidovorax cattleyae TaxID=80868 RepID=UPI001E4EC5AD|nr:hypothetical protein [Paracidovorax cattleyae]
MAGSCADTGSGALSCRTDAATTAATSSAKQAWAVISAERLAPTAALISVTMPPSAAMIAIHQG